MRPTVLRLDIIMPGERTIRRKVIKVHKPREVRADQFFEYRARAALSNMKHRKQRRGDTPDPVLLAVVLQTRFVATQARLLANRRLELLVRW